MGEGRDGGVIVSREDPKKCPHCGSANLHRDPDVLDTWFSSWLWPFSTLGWPPALSGRPPDLRSVGIRDRPGGPETITDLEYFYPTSVLVTAQEIIFFWVARMIMAGLEFMGEVPFHSVFIHGTVRVEGGQKMSKSLGNIIDPLEIIDEMGADALRFSLMMLAATDVYLSREKFEMGRNFTNKIWNATRFVLTHLEGFEKLEDIEHSAKLSTTDKWILTELDKTSSEINECLSNFRFNEATNTIYHFFWGSFCDWYLELVKAVLMGKESPERKPIVQSVLVYVLEHSMRLLHPFMPFISEEIWHLLKEKVQIQKGKKGDRQEVLPVPFFQSSIMLAEWPKPIFGDKFSKEAEEFSFFQEAVVGIRDLRTRLGLKPAEKLKLVTFIIKNDQARERFINSKDKSIIAHLGNVGEIRVATEGFKKRGMVARIYGNMEIFISGLNPETLKVEEDRTKKKIVELEGVIRGIESRLSDSKFVANAPEEIVEKEKEKKEDLAQKLTAYRENLVLFKQ